MLTVLIFSPRRIDVCRGRSCSTMNSVKPKTGLKRKHVTLTISNKLKVIEHLERGTSAKLIAEEFGISRQTVSDIKKRTAAIKAFAQKFNVPNDNYNVSRIKTLRKPKDHALEAALYKWYLQQQQNGTPVDNNDLLNAANEWAKTLAMRGFTCTTGWLCRFKYRHNIGKRSSGENASTPDTDSNMEFSPKDEGTSANNLSAEMPIDVVIKEEEQMLDNQLVCGELPESAESLILKAAQDGIDAVINYVGYSSNRELWSYYDKLRTVREIILEEQRKMLSQRASSYFMSEHSSVAAPSAAVSSNEFQHPGFVKMPK